jgi:hypothetical protein
MVLTALLTFAVASAAVPGAAGAAPVSCSAESGASRVALLELYTSEGCDSCPPADRWVSTLPARGIGTDRVLTLSWHVDYWNYLGWNDPFARAEYSARQRSANQRNRARVIYTPQLMLNGKDYRREDAFADRLAATNRQPPHARLEVRLAAPGPGRLEAQGTASVPDAAHRPDAAAYLALYENNLSTTVAAGENKGKRLRHDFVVRDISGPYPVDSQGKVAFDRRYRLDPGWKAEDLNVAAFVQNERSGEVLQALALRYCKQ